MRFRLEKSKSGFLIFCWALYDLANQFFALNMISLYFPRWLTVEKGTPEILYSVSFGVSMLVIGLCAPVFGIISDRQGKKKIYLINFTLLSVVFTILIGFCSDIFLALLCFAVANFGCQTAIVFYNALLVDVAEKEKVGFVSGLGRTCAYSGALLALYLSKPVIAHYGYQATFVLSGAAFFIFALPAMFFIKEPRPKEEKKLFSFMNREELLPILRRLKESLSADYELHELRLFLKSFFFAMCAIQTMILFMAVYVGHVFGLTEPEIVDLVIFSTFFAVAGSFLSGLVSDRFGYKRSLGVVFCFWFFGIIASALLNPPFQWVLGALSGFIIGATWVIGRAWVVRLVPGRNIGEVFGLFNVVAYLAGVVGPLCWGIMLLCFSSLGVWKYRISLLLLSMFIVLAFYYLSKIPTVKNMEKVNAGR